jgi:hypothetical protein
MVGTNENRACPRKSCKIEPKVVNEQELKEKIMEI